MYNVLFNKFALSKISQISTCKEQLILIYFYNYQAPALSLEEIHRPKIYNIYKCMSNIGLAIRIPKESLIKLSDLQNK